MSEVNALRSAALEKRTGLLVSAGAACALVGVALIELLLAMGGRPFSPLGWSGLGVMAGAALAGPRGLAGGAVVALLYYLLNLQSPERFADFFDSPGNTVAWVSGISMMVAGILWARPRVLRAAAADAELLARNVHEDALRVSERRLRLVADNIPGLIAYVDLGERYQFNNSAFERWFGLPHDLTGRTVREVWGDERYKTIRPNLERALRGERITYEYAFEYQGVSHQVLANYVPDFDVFGRVKGVFVMGTDVTQLAEAQAALRAEHARLEAALDGSSVALWDTDLRTGRVYLSDGWAQIVGGPPGETTTTQQVLAGLVHPDDLEPLRKSSVEAMKGAVSSYAIEHRVRTRSGGWRWILSRGRVTERDKATGRALRMIGTNVDITDRKRIEEAVQSAAQSDPLTHLANRALLSDRLRLALARTRRHGTPVAVLYLDIDRFKDINDRFGHAAGDTLLQDFAARLRTSVRATDTVARFGGDEFVILLEDVKERGHALRIADKVVQEARRPLRLAQHEIVATVSVGVAYSEASLDPDELLKRADAALYEAKAAGRNGYKVSEDK
ncbi:MAG TPA: diguanylate cyclase [Burkholderiales bacterium]|nr:diguanylate cyclase [Burkholderiales bacterium]